MPQHPTPPSGDRTVNDIVADLANADDILERLCLTKELHDWLDAAQTVLVGLAMAERRTHSAIGEALGVSQQAVSKRYGCARQADEEQSHPKEKKSRVPKAMAQFDRSGRYVGYLLPIEEDDLPPRNANQAAPAAESYDDGASTPSHLMLILKPDPSGDSQPWL